MYRLTSSVEKVLINPGLQAAIEAGAKRIFLEGLRSWIRAMIEAIPVWEGTARGGLRPLGRFLRIAVPISPRGPGRRSHKIKGQVYELGPNAGEQYTDYKIDMNFPNYEFEFYETLPYVIWNNFGRPLAEVKSAPWFAFQKAQSAFEQTTQEKSREEIQRIVALMFRKQK